VTGEEIGLFGSEFYTSTPVFPLEKTVACFNLDMVGRVFEPRDTVWNKSPKRVKDFDGIFTLSNDVWPGLSEINQKACKQLGLVPDTTLPPQFLRSSDHYHFHKNNIPVLNYATGYHADYHKVSDEVDKINFAKMKRVAELCFLVGFEVANRTDIEKKAADQ
jgi:Zn-dependent M28 family amino/carboxypeptidase